MNLVSFRNLAEPGGPEFSEAEVKALSMHNMKLQDGPNADGEMFTRKALPSDRFKSPIS